LPIKVNRISHPFPCYRRDRMVNSTSFRRALSSGGAPAASSNGKTAMAERGKPLADWLAGMLLDRRARVAAGAGVKPD
jgi:hypothetical protein